MIAVTLAGCLAPSTIDVRACLVYALITALLLWAFPALLMAVGRSVVVVGFALRASVRARLAAPRIAAASDATAGHDGFAREEPQFGPTDATVVGRPRW